MSEQAKSQNDEAWEALFEKYDILPHIESDGKFTISASQIKEYREPRLMAKFDHHINLPQIFAENRLTILPISRGDYVISHFEAYQPFEVLDGSVIRASLPAHLQSLDANNIPSETIAINCALASGMLSDFLREDVLYSTDIRQTNYYTDAARYLGLLEKRYGDDRKPIYSLSALGERIMNLKYKQRQLAFCEVILQHRAFKETFNLCMEISSIPDTSTIVTIMQESNLYKVESMSTYVRRSSTISSWIN